MLCCYDYVVDVNLDVFSNLCGETLLHHPLICGSRVFRPERHCSVAEYAIRGYESCFDFIIFFQADLIVTRIRVEEGKTFAACRGIDNLIDPREGKVILRTMFIETREIDAHAKDFSVFLRDQHWVSDPRGLCVQLLDETRFVESTDLR